MAAITTRVWANFILKYKGPTPVFFAKAQATISSHRVSPSSETRKPTYPIQQIQSISFNESKQFPTKKDHQNSNLK